MAKQRHQEAQATNSRNSLIILAVGALLVAGLVVWALTRTVEPLPETVAEAPIATPTPTATAPVASTSTTTAATSPLAPAASEDRAEIPRMAIEDFKPKLDRGEVVVVDVRDARAFAAGHIPGAIHMALSSVQANLDLLPKGKTIVTYCT